LGTVVYSRDRSKLKSRIDTAQAAIDSRLLEIDPNHGGTAAERLDIETARAVEVMHSRVTMPW
jgi:hypothetical protein